MKILLLFFLLVSFVYGDEIKRIESIVEDITKLRVQYKECEDSLKTKLENNQKENNRIIKNLETQIFEYKKLLKIKDKVLFFD